MKKEELYELLGEIDEKAVHAAETPPVRKSRRGIIRFVAAAAACVAVAVSAGIWFQKPNSRYNTYKGDMLVAAAAYPEMPSHPKGGDEKDWDKWHSVVAALRDQPEGYKAGFDGFFADSTKEFFRNTQSKNQVYSPLSLYMALGMTAEISGGNTRQQILGILNQDSIESMRSHAQSVWQANYMNDGVAKCLIANSLWTNENLRCLQDTADTVASHYYASVFTGNPSARAYNQLMQDWINEQTDNLLKDSVSGIQMSRDMLISIVSTVNYSGQWVSKFDKKDTAQGTFHAASGDMKCNYMHASRLTNYFWGEHFSSIALPLESNGEMRLLLPDEGVLPEELLQDDEVYRYMMSRMYSGEMFENHKYVSADLTVPKFDVSSDINLTDGLNALGMTDAFDMQKADLTPLTELKPAWISEAKQDARVMIDEEGAKAAAVTLMMAAGAAKPEDHVDFVLDRPFVFEIMSENGLPLFVGIVNCPSAS